MTLKDTLATLKSLGDEKVRAYNIRNGAGKAQFGIPGPGPVLAAWERGEKPVMFYAQYPQSLFGLVTPTDGPIKSVADLKGKVIGTGTVDGAEVGFAAGILSDAGLKGGTEEELKGGKVDYTFLPVGDGGTAFAAFGRGEVAAYSAGISDMTIIRARGLALTEITPPKPQPQSPEGGYATAA